MKKFKKVLALFMAFVMVAGLSVAGTLAYLTDRDSKANVFTVGDVSIELNEEFNQNDTLLPGKDIEKAPTITNIGKNDAWVWASIAIPAQLDNVDASKNVVHFNYSKESVKDGLWTWTDKAGNWIESTYKDANNKEYNVYTVLYQTALKPGETTDYPVMTKVYMDHHVDIAPNGDWYHVENGVADKLEWNTKNDGNPVIYVSAYAIQKETFNDVYEAYAAYNEQWTTEDDVNNGLEWSELVKVEGNSKAAVINAIKNAKDGDVVVLTEDTTIAGYNAAEKLTIEKAIILDLNGKTLTTECGWGGIDAKGGCSIRNGIINHTGNTAAIKAFQVESIENVTINVTETAGKTKGGIVVQKDDSYVGSIKNVTINGVTNGIETYHSTNELAIGSMENVKINATANGIYLNGAGRIGKISNCEIKGGNIGINAYLANLWHISLDIEDSKITGGTTGIDIWDEGATNTGSTVTFNYDNDTEFNGTRENIKVTLQEEITCTINGAVQPTPCDVRK